MRLLKSDVTNNFKLTDDILKEIPPYAILSHTWGANNGDEILFGDIMEGKDITGKNGYRKLEFCRERITYDHLQYFWVDTCCINKSSETELSEAIRSMFKWYQNAIKCYVYLSDVSWKQGDDANAALEGFRSSRWFKRGWTLQELLASRHVEFYSREGVFLGTKLSLEQELHNITKIPVSALRGNLALFDVQERLTWIGDRETTKPEDIAYCMLGLCEASMPLLYGEGEEAANRRLRAEARAVKVVEIEKREAPTWGVIIVGGIMMLVAFFFAWCAFMILVINFVKLMNWVMEPFIR